MISIVKRKHFDVDICVRCLFKKVSKYTLLLDFEFNRTLTITIYHVHARGEANADRRQLTFTTKTGERQQFY